MKTFGKILLVVLVVLAAIYLLMNYTMRGRVLGLYAFGGFKAPISTKLDCAKSTDKKVDEKFKLPLQFDEKSKDALREYWHFSYYRACLFEKGFDFEGNSILPSEMVASGSTTRYTNNFGEVSFNIPGDARISMDNITDPDIEDRRLTSQIISGDHFINVLIYRDFDDLNTIDKIDNAITHLSTSTGNILVKTVEKNTNGVDVLSIEQDDDLVGFVSIAPDEKVVKVFGKNLPIELLNLMKNSLTFNSQEI